MFYFDVPISDIMKLCFAVDQIAQTWCFQLCYFPPGFLWSNSLWTSKVKCHKFIVFFYTALRGYCIEHIQYMLYINFLKCVLGVLSVFDTKLSCIFAGHYCFLNIVMWWSLLFLVLCSQVLEEDLLRFF